MWVLVVTVVCGVVRAGCVFVLYAPVVLLGSHAKVHQTFGKPRHIGDCQKGLDETNQLITFN
jgi:hypothetical protein